ncbi:MAG: hypothetical protein JSS76_18055 [Bacteroidetes bacterium]|nr:hypothetical protein [Bacteroidota bacterium]
MNGSSKTIMQMKGRRSKRSGLYLSIRNNAMNDTTVKRLYTIVANAAPLIFIVWLSITTYDRLVQHDRRIYFVAGLWVLMVAVYIRRLILLYRHGWDASGALYGNINMRRQLYIYAAILAILVVINLVVVWMGRQR